MKEPPPPPLPDEDKNESDRKNIDQKEGDVEIAAISSSSFENTNNTNNNNNHIVGEKSTSSSEDEADAFKRFLASVAILAGTAVGSGCLAIPRATAPAGVIPSSAAMTLVWVFLCFSALCIVESVEATSRKMKRKDVPLHVVAEQVRCLFSVFLSY
jgi:hypothetical protein